MSAVVLVSFVGCVAGEDDPTLEEAFVDKGWTTLFTDSEEASGVATYTPDGSIFMNVSFYNQATGGTAHAKFNKSRFNSGPPTSTVFGFVVVGCEDGSSNTATINEFLADTNDRDVFVDCFDGARAVNAQFLLHVDE